MSLISVLGLSPIFHWLLPFVDKHNCLHQVSHAVQQCVPLHISPTIFISCLFHAHMSLMTTGQPPEVLDKAHAGLLLSPGQHIRRTQIQFIKLE